MLELLRIVALLPNGRTPSAPAGRHSDGPRAAQVNLVRTLLPLNLTSQRQALLLPDCRGSTLFEMRSITMSRSAK